MPRSSVALIQINDRVGGETSCASLRAIGIVMNKRDRFTL